MTDRPPLMQSPPGPYTVINGRRYLYFVGTGYLGLQGHPEVVRAACEAARQYGAGTGTTRAGFGNTPPVLDVERKAADFMAVEDAFYFPSGYAAGAILLGTLADTFDMVFLDELSHYSLCEAAEHCGRPVFRFRHRDADDLRARLRAELRPAAQPLVASDGVFAARGRIAPVAEYAAVLAEYPDATLLLDDAHALGVLGPHGRGTFEHAGLAEGPPLHDPPTRGAGAPGYPGEGRGEGEVRGNPNCHLPHLYLCATLSKALGGYGGIIPGTDNFIRRLKTTSHWYDGASPLPAPIAAATARAIELAADPALRARLRENVCLLKTGLREMGLDVDDAPVPIICLVPGNARHMRHIQEQLMARGIAIAYMPAYAGLGPEGALRLAVFANHTEAMIRQLLDELRAVV